MNSTAGELSPGRVEVARIRYAGVLRDDGDSAHRHGSVRLNNGSAVRSGH
jgi:hypothetical protein